MYIEKLFSEKKNVFVAMIMLFAGTVNGLAQIPASLEKEIDRYNEKVYEALMILNTEPEADALSQVIEIKKELRAESDRLLPKMEALPELSEEQEQAFMEKQMSKALYQKITDLFSDESYIQKVTGSPGLNKEFTELLEYFDLAASDKEKEPELSESLVCTFTVSPEIPNSGTYNVSANEGEALGYNDDTGSFTIEIYGKARGNDIGITMIADEGKPGKYTWSVEGQIYIQSEDDDGNEIIQLQNHHEDGYVSIESIDKNNGIVKGSFKGLFFDDMEQADQPVTVQGTFAVAYVDYPF